MLFRALATWNDETLNIATMIVGAAISVATFSILPKSIYTFLVLVSCFVHNPFSVMYHAKCSLYGHDWHSWKKDVCMIFVASIPLCLGVAAASLPFPLAITWTTYTACVAITYVEHYASQTDAELDKMDYIRHSLRILHIIMCYTIPMIIATSPYYFGVIIPLLIGGALYALKIPERYLPRFRTVGQSTQIMHVCIIIAHVYVYMFVNSMQ